MKPFIDREKELQSLESEYRRCGSSFVVLYGRRRVGKTALLREFVKNKPALYFLATEENEAQNRGAFQELAAEFSGNDLLREASLKSWDPIFSILSMFSSNDKIIIVIDEFQYIAGSQPAFPSILQKIWDGILEGKNIMLILCGSLISMMESQVLNYLSPLYGRRTAQIKLQQIPFRYYREFFPQKTLREQMELYAVTGGVPKYIETFLDGDDIFSMIQQNILRRSGFLYEEPQFLLDRELTETGSYLSILKSIAAGHEKLSQIAGNLEIKQTGLTKYLKTLIDMDLLKREVPVTEERPEKSKRGLYRIKDNYLRFWLRFIEPYKSYIEFGNEELVMGKIRESFVSAHAAYVYEDICLECLWKMNTDGALPFRFTKAGRWWDGNNEIDLVAYEPAGKNILFGECKYTNEVTGLRLLTALEEKAKHVHWNLEDRRCYFIIFSRSGFSEDLTAAARKRDDILLVSEENFPY
ncbi:ATP-binding protein [Cloacibacillus sp.]